MHFLHEFYTYIRAFILIFLTASISCFAQNNTEYNFQEVSNDDGSSSKNNNAMILGGVGAVGALIGGIVGAALTSSKKGHKGSVGSTGPDGNPLFIRRGPASLTFEISSVPTIGSGITYQVYITQPDQTVIVSPILNSTANETIVIPAPALVGPYIITFQLLTNDGMTNVEGVVGVLNSEDGSVSFLTFTLPFARGPTIKEALIYSYLPNETLILSESSSESSSS